MLYEIHKITIFSLIKFPVHYVIQIHLPHIECHIYVHQGFTTVVHDALITVNVLYALYTYIQTDTLAFFH